MVSPGGTADYTRQVSRGLNALFGVDWFIDTGSNTTFGVEEGVDGVQALIRLPSFAEVDLPFPVHCWQYTLAGVESFLLSHWRNFHAGFETAHCSKLLTAWLPG